MMEQKLNGFSPSERIRDRLNWIHDTAGDTIGGAFRLELIDCDDQALCYTFHATTLPWMRNVIGTLHGGSCAALADQAMGCVANCLFADEPHAPTTQLQLNFHRPLYAGDKICVSVRAVNASHSMLHMAAELYNIEALNKLCVSSSAIFFRNRNKEA